MSVISSKIYNWASGRHIAVFTVSAVVLFTNRSPVDAILSPYPYSQIFNVFNLLTAALFIVHFITVLQSWCHRQSKPMDRRTSADLNRYPLFYEYPIMKASEGGKKWDVCCYEFWHEIFPSKVSVRQKIAQCKRPLYLLIHHNCKALRLLLFL